MKPVRLEPVAPRSEVKHSTTEPCVDPEGGTGGPDPPGKSEKYRVS